MWDAVRLEKLGVPAILLVHDVFERAAQAQARALGILGLRYVVYPQPRPEQTPEEAVQDARQVVARIPSVAASRP